MLYGAKLEDCKQDKTADLKLFCWYFSTPMEFVKRCGGKTDLKDKKT